MCGKSISPFFKSTAIILMFFISCSFAWAEKNSSIWDSFVAAPNEENFKICQAQITSSLSGEYAAFQSPTYLQLMKDNLVWEFSDLIEQGNPYATELCFHFYPLFEGNAAGQESFNIDLGTVIKKDPELFLSLFKKYVFSNKQSYFIGGLLGNYGPEYVDEIEKKLNETQERITALQGVKNQDYEEVRDYCIKIVEEHKEKLREIKETLEN